MRRLLCVALALAALSSSAGELRQGGVDEEDASGTLSRPNVLLRAPFTSNAPYIEDDAGTVMHCRGEDFASNTLTCQTGGAWTTTGTVSTDSGFPLFPLGVAGTQRKGLKGWSGSNYLTLGTHSAADALDWGASQDFSQCIVWQPKSAPSEKALWDDGQNGTGGWYLTFTSANISFCMNDAVGGASCAQAGVGPTLNSLTLTCMGRSGSTQFIKRDLDASITASLVGFNYSRAITLPAYIGHYESGIEPDAIIYEIWASTTAASDALFTKIANRFWGLSGGNLSFSRASAQSFTYGGALFFAAPGTPAVDPNRGFLTESEGTNLVLRSEAADNAAWFAPAGLDPGVTANAAVAPDGTTTMDLLDDTSGSNTGNIQQGVAVSSTTGPFIVSAWVKPFGASNAATVAHYCTPDPSATCACACQHLDGTACTCTASAAGANACTGSKTITKMTRLAVTATCSTAVTLAIPFYGPGVYGVSQDKAYFWGMQMELGPSGNGTYASSYIPTAGTAASRSIVQLTTANPLATNDKRWCVDATYAPTELHAWSTGGNNPILFTLGSNGGTNDAEGFLGSTGGVFLITDDASAGKQDAFGSVAADGAGARWNLCNGNGTQTAFKNGVSVASGSTSGAGTAVIAAMPSTLYIGSGQGYAGVDGWVKSFQMGRSSDNGSY